MFFAGSERRLNHAPAGNGTGNFGWMILSRPGAFRAGGGAIGQGTNAEAYRSSQHRIFGAGVACAGFSPRQWFACS